MPTHDSWPEYLQFGKAIGIFFISFVFVANIWYQHSLAYNNAETITNRIFIWEFIFLAVLSLVPIFTKLMTYDTNRHTVMAYGILTTLVNILFLWVIRLVLRNKYPDTKQVNKIFSRIYGLHYNILGAVNIFALILAYFWPQWTVALYLAIPVFSFIFNQQDYTDFEQVANMSSEEKQDYLSASDTVSSLRDLRRQQREIGRKYVNQRKTNPNWQQDMSAALGELFKNNPELAKRSRKVQRSQDQHRNNN